MAIDNKLRAALRLFLHKSLRSISKLPLSTNQQQFLEHISQLGVRGAWRHRRLLHSHPPTPPAEQLSSASRILFVCHGNIMRSAFSAAWLQAELERRGFEGITVESAGVSARDGKPAEQDAQIAAQRLGVCLAAHRARRLCNGQVSGADLIFIMDRLNQVRLERLFPSAKPRTWLLGTLHPEQALAAVGGELRDPYGQGIAATLICFENLLSCLRALADALEGEARAPLSLSHPRRTATIEHRQRSHTDEANQTMLRLFSDLVFATADDRPESIALTQADRHWTYQQLAEEAASLATAFRELGLQPDERVAVYLEKRPESVVALFAASAAAGVAIPINPALKPHQVSHILGDSGASVLVTSGPRLQQLQEVLLQAQHLRTVVVIDPGTEEISALQTVNWNSWPQVTSPPAQPRIDSDMAAILYTSGSTGLPKGVALSHRNLVSGAISVGEYLHNTASDRILSVLPLSFDYGLSQITTAFATGAEVVLLNYLLPRDVVRSVVRHRITGLAAVPPLWIELANLTWPDDACRTLRYITNSGGAMPPSTLAKLREQLPQTAPYLMYGLTEAFRSTYLPPEQIDRRPGSIGKAIPNAEVQVVREDGTPCGANEAGELVHRGPLVSLGYWNAPQLTAQRFRPAPGRPASLPLAEVAVWSGDTVYADEDGYLYFVGRQDEMIKSSGYRISPQEIESVLDGTPGLTEAVAVGVPHPRLGEAILVIASIEQGGNGAREEDLLTRCRQLLPAFMVPTAFVLGEEPLPRNPNGKVDRAGLRHCHAEFFAQTEER